MSFMKISAAREEAYAVPLETLDMSDARRFAAGTYHAYFERLRAEQPVHYCPSSLFGPFWSIVCYDDIKQADMNYNVFSSEGGITLMEPPVEEMRAPMFIAMDPPNHGPRRRTVSPVFAPANLGSMEDLIRSRTISVIESLPIGTAFDWVERVSTELTSQMLATLFDFPFEDRRLLTRWSEVATSSPVTREDWDVREREFQECFAYFSKLWKERAEAPPKSDLISILAHAPATRDMQRREILGTLILLIVGGTDTTRNSMTGGIYFLNQWPGEYDKVRRNPALIPNMVSEIIRYQTPLAYMRRRALSDIEVRGRIIRRGDKVALWYVSGNRDSSAIPEADRFWIDRPDVRQHLSFGFGIHRCVGNRLAELQLRILWEELFKRYSLVEVIGEPIRTPSSFVTGYLSLPVRIVK
jgi:cytochrome P450